MMQRIQGQIYQPGRKRKVQEEVELSTTTDKRIKIEAQMSC